MVFPARKTPGQAANMGIPADSGGYTPVLIRYPPPQQADLRHHREHLYRQSIRIDSVSMLFVNPLFEMISVVFDIGYMLTILFILPLRLTPKNGRCLLGCSPITGTGTFCRHYVFQEESAFIKKGKKSMIGHRRS